jgi:hypothetical protein
VPSPPRRWCSRRRQLLRLYLSGHSWDAFHSSLSSQFGGFDALWVAFGLLAAWRIVGPPRHHA